ncbi:MAG TPA: TAXI family TRAP transporter solute-binding subunit [Desulfuromonadales bacterium]|jgi:TRAP transporter TAXI family solute receptor
MRVKRAPTFAVWGLLLVLLLALAAGSCRPRKNELKLGGGPRGGTFEVIAAGIAEILNARLAGVRVAAIPSGGSVANLLAVQRSDLAMGLVFAGDAYLGRQGRLKENLPPTTGVLALTRLYGATAHLVVSSHSSIRTVPELRGRRVAIGSAGSGSAQAARRFFESIGMWGSIIPMHEGYAVGMEDLRRGNVDAVWLQVGYPSEYLLEVGQEMPLRLIDLYDSALGGGFFSAYPFYAYANIPAETYRGQEQDILTFQDAALWVASPALSEEFVYNALQSLFSENGLERMHTAHPAAWDLEIAKGLMGVKIPLHAGAERFWKEKGISLHALPQH